MDGSKNNGKTKTEYSKKQSNRPSDFSSGPSGSGGNRHGYKPSSSFVDDTSSEVLENISYKKGRNYNSSSFTDGATSFDSSDPSESRNEKKHFKKTSSSMPEAASSAYTDASDESRDERGRYKKSFMEGATSSVYTMNTPDASFQTTRTYNSDVLGSDPSGGTTSSWDSQPRPENIKLMPFKVKDVMEMIKDNPAYKDKSPVMIKVRENDIDQILEGQGIIRGKAEPLDNFFKPQESPPSLKRSMKKESDSFRMSTGAEIGRPKTSMESKQRPEKPRDEPAFAGADRMQKVFAMPDVQAFPVVETVPRRRRTRSRRVMPPRRRTVSRSRSRRPRSRPIRRQSRERRVVRRPVYRKQYISPCTAYPMCDDECPIVRPYRVGRTTRPYGPRRVVSNYNTPYHERRVPQQVVSNYNTVYRKSRTPRPVVSNYSPPYYESAQRVPSYNTPMTSDNQGLYYADSKTDSRRLIHRRKCCCNLCNDKLQFIQPGLCSKKKTVWTNEYAIIPKPQVQLIDPCEELDPSIYPRADNPCIRDGQGNPLTDCIGRPLRSPIGKKFLSFTANGSVMETSVRGNFYTGQPPLCVKCPMPSGSCGQDTTHNWWMSCGYPITANMDPFYKRVLAAEMGPC